MLKIKNYPAAVCTTLQLQSAQGLPTQAHLIPLNLFSL